ncbi:hypothetical protein [Apilactobacillus xinyiensis]|uniref:hypothetical protein n=1 Tax=Apilactobacillus xinyiensis TaxID=2841032 RepID=UPI00200ED216|nr:hypothetical protein [Apilactobacillus xinyiensis]MCL0319395.1 hypothetical protein [Apilactobacillus xinyiensis]
MYGYRDFIMENYMLFDDSDLNAFKQKKYITDKDLDFIAKQKQIQSSATNTTDETDNNTDNQ